MHRILRFLKSEDGPTTVEYAVLLAGILAVVIGGITLVGGQTANFWSNNQSELDTAFGANSGGGGSGS
ncbi:MAG: Flp family type IVb pilin [Planctomycetaceae bacterium]|nr:Flp family type IVb pilin [Planctomycetales bacterium]MCB9873511.1 Flp family type IVb pilin [Planctomycetaceae bacterium]MCB9940421.1 Flp family type IVb pilin [Planctomycetaceae bacterium]